MSQHRFFTSDQHFGHANILKYQAEERLNEHGFLFPTVEQMDDYLVDQWNSVVAENDLVYCLGDFCYNFQQMCDVMPFLNGEKILITGNHDPFFKMLVGTDSRSKMEAQELALQAGFIEVYLQHTIVIPDIGLVRLSHFPYAPPNQNGLPDAVLRYLAHRPARGREKLLLHGHVHSQWLEHAYTGLPMMLNVGVDMWRMRPIAEAEIVEKFRGLL